MTSTRQLPDQTNLMEELAQRCERASGPDRELDGAIWAAIQGVELLIFEASPSSGEVLSYRGELRYPNMPGVARFTESLDAAVTLVPENHQWWVESAQVDAAGKIHPPCAHVVKTGTMISPPSKHSKAATPILALCAASLRARKGLE